MVVQLFDGPPNPVRAETQEESRKGLKGRFLLYRGWALPSMRFYLTCGFCEFVSSRAARSPCANFTASSLAQKCMKIEMGLVE